MTMLIISEAMMFLEKLTISRNYDIQKMIKLKDDNFIS